MNTEQASTGLYTRLQQLSAIRCTARRAIHPRGHTGSDGQFPKACGFSSRQPFHKPSTALSTTSEQRPVIPQDHLRGIVAGGAGDAAARMGAGAAMIEAFERAPVVGVSEHWPCRKQLVQSQRAMKY